MAHLRDIRVLMCAGPGCPKKATVTLYTNRNVEMSSYCARHGKQALARQQEYETRDTQAS